jgi:hypothetical protein
MMEASQLEETCAKAVTDHHCTAARTDCSTSNHTTCAITGRVCQGCLLLVASGTAFLHSDGWCRAVCRELAVKSP